jgi:hypothetical protein
MPINKINITNMNKDQNSSVLKLFIFITFSLVVNPKSTLFPNHKEYDAARTNVVDAKIA